MEALKLFDKKDALLDWEYDGDADTLYISFGKPKPALGVDVGEGVIVRYDEKAREVVGLTLIGVGKRIEEKFEARLVVVFERCPGHLAHDVIAQVSRKISDADAPVPSRRRQRQRLAIRMARRHIVQPREVFQQRRLDVEIQQQIKKFLERVDEFRFVARAKSLLPDAVEVTF